METLCNLSLKQTSNEMGQKSFQKFPWPETGFFLSGLDINFYCRSQTLFLSQVSILVNLVYCFWNFHLIQFVNL